jgi:hypothetical protein
LTGLTNVTPRSKATVDIVFLEAIFINYSFDIP